MFINFLTVRTTETVLKGFTAIYVAETRNGPEVVKCSGVKINMKRGTFGNLSYAYPFLSDFLTNYSNCLEIDQDWVLANTSESALYGGELQAEAACTLYSNLSQSLGILA